VIGVGGGRDIEAALLAGHEAVTAVEVNPALVRTLRAVAKETPLLADPRVQIRVDDGRAAFTRSKEQCTVLQASLVDTWTATSAGAFAHAETTLYTQEAFGVFLRRVEPSGILTLSRWYAPDRPNETSRLLALAMAALLDRHVVSPSAHLAIVASGKVATLMVSPAPFSSADIARLQTASVELGFRVLAAPGTEAASPLLKALLQAPTVEALADVGRPLRLDTSPPTDDRPFFFQLLLPRAWLDPALQGIVEGQVQGNVQAMRQLLLAFVGVFIVGLVLLGPTFWRTRGRSILGAAPAIYFAALGFGFMVAEIALVQRMHLVLGHPTYALVFVLAGLLVATGAGSVLSPRVLRSPSSVTVAAGLATLLLIALPFVVIGPLARLTVGAALPVRALWSGGCSAILGLVLGGFFPSGLRFLARDTATPLALAVNGTAGVVGSILAILVSVGWGISHTFWLAAVAYAVVALSGPWSWRSIPGN
jgi:hypothetical protein